jgi:hypothetical protein
MTRYTELTSTTLSVRPIAPFSRIDSIGCSTWGKRLLPFQCTILSAFHSAKFETDKVVLGERYKVMIQNDSNPSRNPKRRDKAENLLAGARILRIQGGNDRSPRRANSGRANYNRTVHAIPSPQGTQSTRQQVGFKGGGQLRCVSGVVDRVAPGCA